MKIENLITITVILFLLAALVVLRLLPLLIPEEVCFEYFANNYCSDHGGLTGESKLYVDEAPYRFACRIDEGRSDLQKYSEIKYFTESEVRSCKKVIQK